MATIVNDKQILLKESNIEFYREDKCIGSGDLEITSKNIIWTNNNNNNNDNGTEAYETNIYFKFDFCDIMLHAISRDTEAFPKVSDIETKLKKKYSKVITTHIDYKYALSKSNSQEVLILALVI